jgi:Ca2+/H+ antiporter, TMEM165/GDT1 family
MNILVIVATALAAGVEWVEALTIVLAVGLFKGWRSALAGTAVATLALIALIVIFGAALTTYVPIVLARFVVGFFLLLFGLKWLSKAVLRSAGLKALHDEAATFEETKEYLEEAKPERGFFNLDRVGFTTSFSGVFLEGLEVVFIVLALGGLNGLPGATLGAAASLAIVVVVGIVARAPLTRVPENSMKYVVGVMLTAFGTFFVGEGIGVQWWREDLVLIPLIILYGLASIVLVQFLKRPPRARHTQSAGERTVRAIVSELWSLLVGDGAIAVVCLAVVFGIALYIARNAGAGTTGGVMLVAGVLISILAGFWVSGAFKDRAAKAQAAVAPAQSAPPASPDGMPATREPTAVR